MPFWTLRRKFVAAVTLLVALTVGWAAVVVAVALTGAHDEARSADAIAVLGAAQYNGRPSPVFRARLDHAAALYQRGLAPVVLVTGGVGTGDTVSESEVGRRYLTKAGLPETAVIALAAGSSTASSVSSIARWLEARDGPRVLLVSDGFPLLPLRLLPRRAAGSAGLPLPGPRVPDPVQSPAQRGLLPGRGAQGPRHLALQPLSVAMQLDTRRIYTGRVVRLDVDTVRFPDGSTGQLELIRHPGAAAIVPCASDPPGADPTILLIRQYRYATGGQLWEVPAGTLDPGEDPEACARRELLEETGVTAARLQRLTSIDRKSTR